MALQFPWEMYMQAQQEANKNQQQMYQNISGLGQTLGQGMQSYADQVRAQKQKEQWGKTINQMLMDPTLPEDKKQGLRMAAPFLNSSTVGQLMPNLLKQQKPPVVYRPFPGVLSDTNNPLVINESTGEVSPSKVTGKSTSKTFGTDTSALKWESLSPEEQKMAINIYNGNVDPSHIGYRERTRLMMGAEMYADNNKLPPYQSFGGSTKGTVSKSFASGKPAMNVLSLNTAIGHAGTAMDAFNQVNNTNQRWLNVPLNKARTMSNDPNIIKLGVSLNALHGELATVFKGTAGTDQEIGKWMENLSENLTPLQASVAIPQVLELLKSRQSALESMRTRGMSNRPGSGPLLSPHAKEVSDQVIKAGAAKSSGGWSYVGPGQ